MVQASVHTNLYIPELNNSMPEHIQIHVLDFFFSMGGPMSHDTKPKPPSSFANI